MSKRQATTGMTIYRSVSGWWATVDEATALAQGKPRSCCACRARVARHVLTDTLGLRSGDEESGDDPELLTVPAVMCGDEGVLSRAGFLNAQSLALLAVVVVLTVAAFNDLATSPAADGGGGSGVGGGDHQNNDDTVVPGGTPGAGAVAGGGDATEVGVPVSRVWSYGWITAASTGLGALPFFWLHKVDKWWLGICNAAAAGMMAAASIGLMVEACDEANVDRAFRTPAWVRMVLGIILGGLFLRQTQTILDQYEHLKFAGLSGVDAKKMLLIMAVMTLHSCAEGVGIGVSFVGDIGPFISTALAIHNVPEGLAICLVLIPREVHLIDAALWAIFSSMPQPLMAVPAYMSVSAFIPFLPLGLGFAAGAMGWVCAFDLAPEAISECGKKWTAVTAAAAACAMGYAQIALR